MGKEGFHLNCRYPDTGTLPKGKWTQGMKATSQPERAALFGRDKGNSEKQWSASRQPRKVRRGQKWNGISDREEETAVKSPLDQPLLDMKGLLTALSLYPSRNKQSKTLDRPENAPT